MYHNQTPFASRRFVRNVFTFLLLLVFMPSCAPSCSTFVSKYAFNLPFAFFLGAEPTIYSPHTNEMNQITAVPNTAVTRTIFFTGSQPSLTTDLMWTPPPGASDFTFSVTPQTGSPPFLFTDVAESAQITVGYTTPDLPDGVTSQTIAESLAVILEGIEGQPPTAILYTELTATAQTTTALSAAPVAPQQPATPTVIDSWQTELWVDILGQTLDTATCQDWLDFFQSDETFFALRLPMPITGAGTSIQLPLIYDSASQHTLRLVEYSVGNPAYITSTLQFDADRATLLANTLPRANDEYWMALNVDTVTPAACPPGLNLEPDTYGLYGQSKLDMTAFPDNCVGCELAFEICYEGQDPPMAAAVLQQATQLSSYQGEGITCLGPMPLLLDETSPALELHGDGGHVAQPSETIAAHHFVTTNSTMDVTFSVDSDLGASWGVYHGDGSAPDLGDPITGAVTVNGYMDVWVVGDVPAAASSGAYDMSLTATGDGPGDVGTAVHLIWVGDWVAPPPPTMTGFDNYLYLPTVLKP
ncbi:MAG: hypothetical protein H6662_16050 [Ardenticatenaceae bacterium]|nr:hypothetical protein [Ardenticatenaceae bacterium]MCB8990033.1 hypothetical protein [Ardenticatenaceae bacterium]